MGYFSNGTEGDIYQERHCSACVHSEDPERGCPVWDAHLLFQDCVPGQVKEILGLLIPKHGCDNLQCRMFVHRESIVPSLARTRRFIEARSGHDPCGVTNQGARWDVVTDGRVMLLTPNGELPDGRLTPKIRALLDEMPHVAHWPDEASFRTWLDASAGRRDYALFYGYPLDRSLLRSSLPPGRVSHIYVPESKSATGSDGTPAWVIGEGWILAIMGCRDGEECSAVFP